MLPSSRKRNVIANLVLFLSLLVVFQRVTVVGQNCNVDCPAGGVPVNQCGTPPCPSGWVNQGGCCCNTHTPIVIDVDRKGFSLTSLAGGVYFDIANLGTPNEVSWTAIDSTNAWLVLDRDGDGSIDDGAELFGNDTPQPEPPPGRARNGFLALAVFDSSANGGNGDGKIDARDAVFTRLRLWQDKNHDGKSSPDELKTLPELGIAGISLAYEDSLRQDQFGNEFRYRAQVFRTDGSHDWGVVDVILLVGPPAPGSSSR